MQKSPRPKDEPILTRSRWTAIGLAAVVMATGTLVLLATTDEALAGTVAFTTFVLFQFFNILNARHDTRSVFHRDTLGNRWLWVSLAAVLLLQVAVVYVGFLQRLFDTAAIEAQHWLLAIAVASTVVWVEEVRKLVARRRMRAES
ncbi:MAG: cation transporting ATPase C-terminal domain-containing protein, partial [Ilumatobacteraceae bacterium]